MPATAASAIAAMRAGERRSTATHYKPTSGTSCAPCRSVRAVRFGRCAASVDSSDPPRPALTTVAIVRAAGDAIRHRGPDHGATAPLGRCTLGYRRLSVIDLATGDQPVTNESGDVVVVFNGEIYNYRALRAALERQGHELTGTGDTPALPHLYEQHGDAFVEHLDGMFALAVWDALAGSSLLARDRFGKKPLLWTQLADGTVAFASELKALRQIPRRRAARRPRAARRLPRARLRARRPHSSAGINRSRRAASLSVERRPGHGRALLAARCSPGRPRPTQRRGMDRGGPGRAFAQPYASGSSRTSHSGRSSLAASTRASSWRPWPRRAARPCERSRSGSPKHDTTSAATRAWSPSALARSHEELLVEPDAAALLPRLADAYDEPFGDTSTLPTFLVCGARAAVRHGRPRRRRRRRDLRWLRAVSRARARRSASTGCRPALPGSRRARFAACRGTHGATLGSVPPARFLDTTGLDPAERYGRLMQSFPRDLRQNLWTDDARHRIGELENCRGTARTAARERHLRAPAHRRRHVPAGRPPLQGRYRVDGALARAAGSAPRLRARGARARPPRRPHAATARPARSRCDGRSQPTCRPRSSTAARPASVCPSPRWFREELRDLAGDVLLGSSGARARPVPARGRRAPAAGAH